MKIYSMFSEGMQQIQQKYWFHLSEGALGSHFTLRGNCCVTSGRYGTPALVLWRATTIKYSKSFLSCNSIRSLSNVRYRPVCLSMDWTDTRRWLWAVNRGEEKHIWCNTPMSCAHINKGSARLLCTAICSSICVVVLAVQCNNERKKTVILICLVN